jgi:FPC/CPF motif-containing protein YcgG
MPNLRNPAMTSLSTTDDNPLARRFREFIQDRNFPCVGAKSALAKGNMRIITGRDLRSAWDDLRILPALLGIARDYALDPVPFQSLAVVFEEDAGLDEKGFERHLWERLQSLSDKDDWLGQPVDPRVSTDPDDPHFSLSFGGEAFFVVGLHPGASRPARRFDRPVIVFNLHDQFEQLRTSGIYEKLRGTIIDRDIALAGQANPMLALHGTISEARQYSGRAVDERWQCPLRPRKSLEHAL